MNSDADSGRSFASTGSGRAGIGRAVKLAGVAAAIALTASACGSSGGSSGGGGSAAAGGGGATTGGNAGSAVTTVSTHSGPMGTFLTGASGKSLYMFASDTASKSTCSGTCTVYWPPLMATGTVHASGGLAMAKFATISRSDGGKQVTYAGHPLYYYAADSAPGDTKGEGSSNFGAKWWLLAPSGSPITTGSSTGGSSSPSSSSSSSSGGGGGGGGWG